jgi:ABC-type polysaccharide transport system permease subunit
MAMKELSGKTLSRLPLLFLPFGAVALLSLVLPVVTYTYKKAPFVATGFEFLRGIDLNAGTVHLPPNLSFVLIVAASAVAILLPLFRNLLKPRLLGKILLASGFVQLVAGILFLFMLKSELNMTKKPTAQLGLYLPIAGAILLIVLAAYFLYKIKFLSLLDFMVVPGLTYLLINNYLPLIGISIAFKRIDYSLGVWKSPWAGLENFQYLFQSQDALIITRNTLLYNATFIILGNIMGIIVGLALSEIFSRLLQKVFQTVILLPQLISMVIVAYITFGFLSTASGFINKSLLETPVDFYSTPGYWPFILVFVHIWKGLGYSSIIYLSSIIGIDHNLYEAARIDGCGRLKTIWTITLPLLKPTIFTLVLLQFGRIFYSDFGLFYQVPANSGALYNVTNTIDTYVYRALMQLSNISMASAASAFQAIVGFVLVFTVNMLVRWRNKENALF